MQLIVDDTVSKLIDIGVVAGVGAQKLFNRREPPLIECVIVENPNDRIADRGIIGNATLSFLNAHGRVLDLIGDFGAFAGNVSDPAYRGESDLNNRIFKKRFKPLLEFEVDDPFLGLVAIPIFFNMKKME